MNSLPEIDVVLLSWNRSQMTIETIKSILEQQGVNPKIWIVDQGSEREELQYLKAFIKPYSNIHITELDQNVGVPGGRNIGTYMGKAPYAVSIDNDAVFESNDALERVVEIFDSEPEIGVISFRIKNFYTGQDDELSWAFPKKLKENCESRFFATCFVGCGHAIRRNIFETVEGYDDALFFYWEETDFSYRVINLGYRLIYEPHISVLHKVSPEARISWENNRFYYLVRNAIYINYKYYQQIPRVTIIALGYCTKGIFNFLPKQTVLGIIDGTKMCFSLKQRRNLSELNLTESSRQYIWQHNLRYRGSFWHRIRNEVLVSLPGHK
jgi:GT2 family glycosyltransferase